MTEKRSLNTKQNVILENRERLSISGVEHVDNFNDNSIVLSTVKGAMTIKGQSLNINKLNLEDGNVTIEGTINSITYTNKDISKTKGSGILGKMFK